MAASGITGCELHIPFKDWSPDQRERNNYDEIERWSIRLQNCLGGCECGVLEWVHSFSIPDSTIVLVTIPGTTTLCGSVVASHMFVATFNFRWDGSTLGTIRHVDVDGIGESSTASAMDSPPLNYFGQQNQEVVKFFPAHLNTVSPKYQIHVYQDSGGPINCAIRAQEWYPCCDCDWAYGC
jgi:hypothetical protein